MPVELSVPVVLATERGEYDRLLSELSKFRYFHFYEEQREFLDVDLVDRLDRIYSRLHTISEKLGIQKELGVIEALRKGYREEDRKTMIADSFLKLIADLEKSTQENLDEIERLLDDIDKMKRKLDELRKMKATIRAFSTLRTSLSQLERIRRFSVQLVVISRKDLEEIKRSIGDEGIIFSEPVSRQETVCAVISTMEKGELVERVLKAFDVLPVRIPEGYPDIPSEAFDKIKGEIVTMEKELQVHGRRLMELKADETDEIASLLEASELLREQVRRMKSPTLKRIAIIAGYVPGKMLREFMGRFGDYLISIQRETSETPTLLRNGVYTSNFEPITLTQGLPSKEELDPTPVISIVFPAFFGLMFGDVGHGILLALTGLLLKLRGFEELRKWGTALMAFGVSSMLVGLVTGEIFGLPLYGEMGVSLAGVRLPLLHVSELSADVALQLLSIALLVGVIHITIGLVMDFYQTLKNRSRMEALLVKLPLLVLYIAGIFFSLAFIYSGYSFDKMWMNNPTPLGISTGQTTQITLPILLMMSAIIIAGRSLLRREGSAMGGLMEGLVEWLLKIIEFMANTMSYARLAVLLLVHTALLQVVNMGFGLGTLGIGVVVIGNIGVIMLEGLIVYIQDLRLHIYEWFTKFYEGTGISFKPITLEGKRIRLGMY